MTPRPDSPAPESAHEREEAERLLEPLHQSREAASIWLWMPALNNHVRTATEEEVALKNALQASLARERELRVNERIAETERKRAEAQLVQAHDCIKILEGVLDELRDESAIEFEDTRLSYLTVQVTRRTWYEIIEARRALQDSGRGE